MSQEDLLDEVCYPLPSRPMRSLLSCQAVMCGGVVSLAMVILMGLTACARWYRRSTKRTGCVVCPAPSLMMRSCDGAAGHLRPAG